MSRCPFWSAYILLDDKELLSVQPDDKFIGASMIKSFILEVVISQISSGVISWDDIVTVSPFHRVGGDGVLQHWRLPTSISLHSLCQMMISLSDNVATNAVISYLGGVEEINNSIASLGYLSSRLRANVGGRDKDPRRDSWIPSQHLPTRTGISVVTAREHARCIDNLLEDDEASSMLYSQKDRRSLARDVGLDAVFYHKTGTADGVRHDGGVMVIGDHRLSAHCFTDGYDREEHSDDFAYLSMSKAMRETVHYLLTSK